MSVLNKVITALRGGIHEIGEALIDTQALRILDQEVRDASATLNQSKKVLAENLANQTVAKEKIELQRKEITEFEGYALEALKKKNKSLALDVAEKVAAMENELTTLESVEKKYVADGDAIRDNVIHAENTLRRLKQQLDTVRATESVQRAQKAVAERHQASDQRIQTAMDSLERIKAKRNANQASESSSSPSNTNATDDLKAKLKDAGIISLDTTAEDVLARLKKK